MIDAQYYDGRVARAQAVRIAIDAQGLTIALPDSRVQRVDWQQVEVAEQTNAPVRLFRLSDGASLEVARSDALARALQAAGRGPSPIERAQRRWSVALAGVAALIAAAALAFQYGLPLVARSISAWIPVEVERRLGEHAMTQADRALFSPSLLRDERRESLMQQFAQWTQQMPGAPRYTLIFRSLPGSPNALALPGGIIVVTDELVLLAPDDTAVLTVLAHELGHVKHRHAIQAITQGAIISTVVSLWIGDISSFAAATASSLVQMSYSRDAETQADDEALRALELIGASGASTAQLFERISDKLRDGELPKLLSSHPPTAERIARFRAANPNQK